MVLRSYSSVDFFVLMGMCLSVFLPVLSWYEEVYSGRPECDLLI